MRHHSHNHYSILQFMTYSLPVIEYTVDDYQHLMACLIYVLSRLCPNTLRLTIIESYKISLISIWLQIQHSLFVTSLGPVYEGSVTVHLLANFKFLTAIGKIKLWRISELIVKLTIIKSVEMDCNIWLSDVIIMKLNIIYT